jgi:hypothetical protein
MRPRGAYVFSVNGHFKTGGYRPDGTGEPVENGPFEIGASTIEQQIG